MFEFCEQGSAVGGGGPWGIGICTYVCAELIPEAQNNCARNVRWWEHGGVNSSRACRRRRLSIVHWVGGTRQLNLDRLWRHTRGRRLALNGRQGGRGHIELKTWWGGKTHEVTP